MKLREPEVKIEFDEMVLTNRAGQGLRLSFRHQEREVFWILPPASLAKGDDKFSVTGISGSFSSYAVRFGGTPVPAPADSRPNTKKPEF